MNGSVTVQVPVTEDYVASNGIAMFSADSNGINVQTSGGTGQTGSSLTVYWSYIIDGNSGNDGFTGSTWITATGPFSNELNNDNITNNIGTTINVEQIVSGWLNSNASNTADIMEFLNAIPNNCFHF